MPTMPKALWMPSDAFAEQYGQKVAEGRNRLQNSKVAFVGLARNCAPALTENLRRAERIGAICTSWSVHVESNDCHDNTLDALVQFCNGRPNATFHYQILGRKQYSSEFSGRRTIALAEYRDACQRWVRACAADSDYVFVVDWDAAGGWNEDGLLNGIGWLVEMQGAYGMASTSLFQHDWGSGPQWCHYDLWALRGIGQPGCFFDSYRNGCGAFGFTWLPPVGSEPVLVASAFGGMCIYRTDAYLKGTYDGVHDVEHVPFHRSIARVTGQHLYLCPAMRTLMSWLPEPCAA